LGVLNYIIQSNYPFADALLNWFSKDPRIIGRQFLYLEWVALGLDSTDGYHLLICSHALSCVVLWRVLARLRFPILVHSVYFLCSFPEC